MLELTPPDKLDVSTTTVNSLVTKPSSVLEIAPLDKLETSTTATTSLATNTITRNTYQSIPEADFILNLEMDFAEVLADSGVMDFSDDFFEEIDAFFSQEK